MLEGEFVDPEKLKFVQHISQESKRSLGEVIVEKELISDENLGQLIAAEMGVPFVHLGKSPIYEEVLEMVPEQFAQENMLIPFKKDEEGLHVATSKPDIHVFQQLEKKSGVSVVVHYTTPNLIRQALHLYKKGLGEKIKKLAEIALNEGGQDVDVEQDTAVIEIVDLLFDYAYTSRASDLHLEPQEVDTVIRFRQDGVLHDVLNLPKGLHERLVTRVKIMSRLRTDSHFVAQDGHLKYTFADEHVDVRVSILPITFGEKVVMRLLSEKSRQFSLEAIGMNASDLEKLKTHARKPWGMILVTGPTGSGKTTTLYAVLKILNRREVNISTIEDPVEYSISGVNQVQVNTKTDLTFSHGLRSLVRQDPDIIMVGEIRDEETSAISVNAALTGHLLLSTLHTNDSATALPRLLDMGVQPFLVASSVNLIVAQRLVRKVCAHCRHSYETTLSEIEESGLLIPESVKSELFDSEGKVSLYKGKGCPTCHDTGYAGRTGIFEVLEVDPEVRKMILAGESSDVIRDYAVKAGMTTMFDDAVEKVKNGETTIQEMLRVVRE